MKRMGLWFLCCLIFFLTGCGKTDVSEPEALEGMFRPTTFGMAKTEDGIYIANSSIYFFDPETGQSTILCNKPDCDHENYDICNAKVDFGNHATLFYQNGYLYMFGIDEETEELCIYQIRPDGSGYETYLTMANASAGAIDARTVCYHNDFWYFIITEKFKTRQEYHLYQIKLEKNAKPEEVFTMDAGLSELISVYPGEDGIWMQRQYLTETSNTGTIYFLRDDEKEPEIVLDQIPDCRARGPVPVGDTFYYLSNQEIWKYSDGEKTVITKRGKEGDVQKGVLVYRDWIFDSTGEAINIYKKEDGTLVSSVDHKNIAVTSQQARTECYLAGVDNFGLYLAVIDQPYSHSLYYMKLEHALNERKGEWVNVLEKF